MITVDEPFISEVGMRRPYSPEILRVIIVVFGVNIYETNCFSQS